MQRTPEEGLLKAVLHTVCHRVLSLSPKRELVFVLWKGHVASRRVEVLQEDRLSPVDNELLLFVQRGGCKGEMARYDGTQLRFGRAWHVLSVLNQPSLRVRRLRPTDAHCVPGLSLARWEALALLPGDPRGLRNAPRPVGTRRSRGGCGM